jgi:hypothetical protein
MVLSYDQNTNIQSIHARNVFDARFTKSKAGNKQIFFAL